MTPPFRVRRFAGVRAGFPLALLVAAALTSLWGIERFLPALRLEPGAPAPVNVRRPARTDAAPADPAARTDLDAFRHETVDPRAHADILAWQRDRVDRLGPETAAVFGLFVGALLVLSFYLRRFGRGLVRFRRAHVVTFLAILLMTAAFKLFLLLTPWSPYLFPLAAAGLVLAHHLGRRAGISILLATGLVGASLLAWDVVFLLVILIQALVLGAMLPLRRRRPGRLVPIGLAGGLASLGVLVAAAVAAGRTDIVEGWLYVPQANPLVGALAGALAAGILGWMINVPAGWALGVVSRARLLDLQDIENPLLRRLRERAPGTWEHSRSMANLAEAAAAAIGADALLVRVGAYYHDVGKIAAPDDFIENINAEPGQEHANPHEGMDPRDSAERIIRHVVAGVDRLRHHGVPEAVVDFAYMHHGRSVIEYFWGKAQEAGNPHGYVEADFRYPGMRPQTRETGILMLVDAVEAASRTVHPPIREKFRAAVERIVLSKLSQGQLDESDLSLEDVHVVMEILVDALVHGHHERVPYPWQRKAEQDSAAAPRVEG